MNQSRAVLWTILISFVAVTVPGGFVMAQDRASAENLKPPRDGGVRRWQVTVAEAGIFAVPGEAAKRVMTLGEGAVLQNRGCSENAGQVWCDIRSLSGNVRGYALAAHLKPAKGPDGIVATGTDDSRVRAGKRDFDAEAVISCAQEQGQALGKCNAAAARGVGGDATVVVTFQNGFARKLYFVHGEFVKASATMSGVGTDMDWRLENKIHHVRVDDQRFELPDRFVFGE
ncbi:hypothetical protein [Roseibium sp. MMSF_3412]|uniref:hypothetical protein n=1 Tax=Roseibium sp. MMSF_3412 TaxID=3046712 RepID=UPI00273F3590|nr:hypothetical protein [Roseibium sp. MMSF_3412]